MSARQVYSLNCGSSCGETYHTALDFQKMLFAGRIPGSPSSTPAGTSMFSVALTLCGTRVPHCGQNHTAKRLASGRSKRLISDCSVLSGNSEERAWFDWRICRSGTAKTSSRR